MTKFFEVKGAPGAGDVVQQLNSAFALSAYEDEPVHLIAHWTEEGDYHYVEGDPESLAERYEHMHEYMREPERVTIEHVYSSNKFAHIEKMPIEERRKKQPERLFIDGNSHETHRTGQLSGFPEWEWKDNPIEEDLIVCWHQGENRESVKTYKEDLFNARNWKVLFIGELPKLFPETRVETFSYRDDFRDVYALIRKAKFCVGYDGMWHGVARNFAKVFLSQTGDPKLSHRITNPNSPIFYFPHQFYEYLNHLRDDEYLKSEQEYMKKCHERRMRQNWKS